VLEVAERISLMLLSLIEQPEVSRAVRHERDDWHERQRRMQPSE
jgi:hypothetical protein